MWETLEVLISKPIFHCRLVFRLELQFCSCHQQHGAAVDERLCGLVLNVTCGVAPWVKIFQSSMSMVDSEASLMKTTSVDFVIMALLNTLCFVIVAMFMWCTSPRITWKRLVLPLFASPVRHGTLSLWHFLLKLRSFRKS